MGANASVPAESAEEAALEQGQVPRVKLYAFDADNSKWTIVSTDARPEFYDANEDSGDDAFSWMIDIGSEVSCAVSENMQMLCDSKEPRVTFVADGVYALKFPSKELADNFVMVFNNHAFENVYQMEATDANQQKVYGKDFVDWATGKDGEEADFDEFMDMSDINMAQPAPTNYSERKSLAGPRDQVATQLETGANRNSYLVRGDTVDVLRNVENGVEDEGISIKVSDREGQFFTPQKVMLARGERDMLMMTPEVGGVSKKTSLFQMDIENGKVVSEWAFNKDGVDIPMRDINHDNKAGQIESRDTFLGLDDNRLCRWDMRTAGGVVQDMTSPSVMGVRGGAFAPHSALSLEDLSSSPQ